MDPVQSFLADRDPGTIRASSIGLASLGFSVVSVSLAPRLEAIGPVLQVLVSTVSLGILYWLLESLLARWRTRAVRGTWVYDSPQGGNVGLAHISIFGGSLRYRVQLFPDFATLDAYLEDSSDSAAISLAHAESTYAEFVDRRIQIRYEVNQTGVAYQARAGFLVIEPTFGREQKRMTGYWTSASDSGEPKRGQLDFRRRQTVQQGVHDEAVRRA